MEALQDFAKKDRISSKPKKASEPQHYMDRIQASREHSQKQHRTVDLGTIRGVYN